MGIILGRLERGEQVRHGCAHGDEGKSRHDVRQADDTAEQLGEVGDAGGDGRDADQGHEEGQPSSEKRSWWTPAEHNLPRQRDEVHDPVRNFRLCLVFATAVDEGEALRLLDPVRPSLPQHVEADVVVQPALPGRGAAGRMHVDGDREERLLLAAVVVGVEADVIAGIIQDDHELAGAPPQGLLHNSDLENLLHLARQELYPALHLAEIQA
mmetsp:Transcript_86633/g.279764  ORF Transcript_86633/g.279764 Transcript_86633/m.279764 type:complete len:211 (+) Transcript_86633:872-1504(+)